MFTNPNLSENSSEIEIPKQNISAILNNPLQNTSYFDMLKYKYRNSLIKKEEKKLEKSSINFTIIDIIQNNQNNNNNNNDSNDKSNASTESSLKNTFLIKDYINENYDDFINKIKNYYGNFKYNHLNKIKEILIEKKLNNFKYESNVNKILLKIENEFLINEKKYKINEKLLILNTNEMSNSIKNFIQKTSMIDLELENCNLFNKKLFNFINENYPELQTKILIMCEKISLLKKKKSKLKKYFFINYCKLLLKQQKLNNLNKILNYFLNLKEIYEQIKNKKLKNLNEKFLKNFPDFNLKKELKKNIDEIQLFSYENYLKELENFLLKIFEEKFIFEEQNLNINNNNEINNLNINNNYNINLDLLKNILKNNKKNNFLLLKIILINDENFNEINKKIQNYPKNINIKIETIIIKIIDNFFNFIYNKIKILKEKNEILFIFYYLIISQNILNLFKNIFKENKQQIKTIKLIIINLLEKKINFIYENNKISNISDFIDNNNIIKKIFSLFDLSKKINYLQKFEDFERQFIFKYFSDKEVKITELIQFENFNNLNEIPSIYQEYIQKIENFNLINIDSYEKINEFFNMENDNNNNNILNLKIKEKNIKIISTSLDLLTFTIETLKMLCSFNINNYSIIIASFFSVYQTYLNLIKENVLENKKNIQITQNEICISYSNLILFKEIINIIYQNENNHKLLNQFSNNEFDKNYNEFILLINNILNLNEKKIEELLSESCINLCLNDFNKLINNNNYQIPFNNELPINNFASNLVKMTKSIYKNMFGIYDNLFIKEIMIKNLDRFANEMEKILNGKEIEGIEEKKQFKKDLIFIKKNIDSGIEFFQLKNFKNKISMLYKKYVPESNVGKKKKKEKDEK